MKMIKQCIKLLKNTMGEKSVKLISTEIERSIPTQNYPHGVCGVMVEINKQKSFLSYSHAEDIIIYGQHLADEYVYQFYLDEMKLIERGMKIKKIKNNIL